MDPVKCQKSELKHVLKKLARHNVKNPDGDSHWSGVVFFGATDDLTRSLIEQIEILAGEVFFDHLGRARRSHMRATYLKGIRIRELRSAPSDETVIQITLPQGGYITVSTARL